MWASCPAVSAMRSSCNHCESDVSCPREYHAQNRLTSVGLLLGWPSRIASTMPYGVPLLACRAVAPDAPRQHGHGWAIRRVAPEAAAREMQRPGPRFFPRPGLLDEKERETRRSHWLSKTSGLERYALL